MRLNTRDDLVRDVAGLSEYTAPESDNEKNGDSEDVFSVEKQLMSPLIAKTALGWQSLLTVDVLKAFV